jgi:hypothetical protein
MVFIQYISTIGKLYGKFRVVIEELVNQSGEEEANGSSDPQDHSVLGVKCANVPDIFPQYRAGLTIPYCTGVQFQLSANS